MRRPPTLLTITSTIFLLGQVYVLYALLNAPLSAQGRPDDTWSQQRHAKPAAASAQQCPCSPSSAWPYRGLSVNNDAVDYANTPISALRPPSFYRPGNTAPLPPLVSVVIPYYNSAATLRDTIVSVLRQSMQWIEIIICDDASPAPDTAAFLGQIAALDKRIKIVRNERNSGLAATRNAGAAEARGEFLFFLDSDDLIEPTALEVSAWYLRCRPTHAFVGGWTVGFGAQEYLWKRGYHSPGAFVRENLVTATKMLRREHFLEVGSFDADLRHGNEDWEFWLRMANAGRWGDTLPLPMDWYRRKPRDQSKADWAAWTEKGGKEFLDLMRSRYPRLFVQADFPTVVPAPAFNSSKLWNPLQKDAGERRLILVTVPRPASLERREVLARLVQCGWQLTVCLAAADATLRPEDFTPDVFMVSTFVALPHQLAPFVQYLGQSRKADLVVAHKTYRSTLEIPMLRANLTMRDEVDFLAAWSCPNA